MMQHLDCGQPYYARLEITEEKLRRQIAETGGQQSLGNLSGLLSHRLHYYPFYLIHIHGVLRRRLLHNLHKETLISVDAVKGYYALARLLPSEAAFDREPAAGLSPSAAILQPQLLMEEAWEKGINGLRKSNAFSLLNAFWLNRQVDITPLQSALVYKPYWRIEISTPQDCFIRVVDAASGEVGGNNAYRFLQGYETIRQRSGFTQ